MAAQRTAAQKLTTVRRELTLQDLVIPDLQNAEATGRYDRNVLLWLQDRYVLRAMKERASELLDLHREIDASGASEGDRWRRKMGFLVDITNATYKDVQGDGGGFSVRLYVDAACAFWEAEASVYAGQLLDVAAYIRKAIEAGVEPDLERFAREAYVSMARMSGAITKLDALPDQARADQVAKLLKGGIETINYVAVTLPGQTTEVGRELLKLVNQISASPDRYIEFVDPRKSLAPMSAPWDFAPADRGSQAGNELAL